MRSRRIRITVLALAGACMMAMSGCGEEAVEEPISTSTIVLAEDGSFTQYRIEAFDKEYYQLSELDSMIRQEVQEYVSAHPGQAPDGGATVRVEAVSRAPEDQSQAMVALYFADSPTFEDYVAEVDQQPSELFYGTVQEALVQGYDLTGVLLDAKKGTAITQELLEKSSSRMVLVFADSYQIRCPSKVLYRSSNVSLTDAGYADGSGDGLKYIVLK